MSVFQRMSDVIQQKVNSVLDRAEDPNQALDLSYQKQLEALQQVRRGVADVLTSEKRLELQRNELQQSQSKLQAQAREALARFAAALDALPALQREAFLLHEESGLSVAEIAAATGSNEEAAKSRLRYAMAKLKAAINDG